MKLLLDQGLPRSAAKLLRESGLDVVHVGEVGLATAKDGEILAHAGVHGRTVVTLDADFHALLMVNRQTAPSVIRIRLEGLKGKELATILETALATVSADVERGALVTVTARSIRVHRLKERLGDGDEDGGTGGRQSA